MIYGGDFIKEYLIVNINNKNTEILLIRKNRNKYIIQNQLNYEMGSKDLKKEENNEYINQVTKIIKDNTNQKLKNIYFTMQNDEIIIRNIKNINSGRKKEIIQLIKYEIGNYMPLDLQNYVIKYKKIINARGKGSIQGILFPKKYVDICKSISEKLKIKKRYLYINFDILQKLMDLRIINISQNSNSEVIIIENREKDMILNKVFNSKIIESYVVDKTNNQYSINQFPDNNTYYYGIKDDFIENLQVKKLYFNNKLILNDKEEIIDITLDYLPALGMIL